MKVKQYTVMITYGDEWQCKVPEQVVLASDLPALLRDAMESGFDICLSAAAKDDWSVDIKAEALRRYPDKED